MLNGVKRSFVINSKTEKSVLRKKVVSLTGANCRNMQYLESQFLASHASLKICLQKKSRNLKKIGEQPTEAGNNLRQAR